MTTIYIKNDVLNRLSIPDVKLYIVHLIFKVFCRRLCCVEISRFARNDTGSASVISTGGRDLRSTVVFRRRQKAQYAGQGGDTGTVGPTGQGGAIGTVGNAGQGDDTGTQLGACQNTADQAIFNAVDVAAEVETCATDCALKTDVNTCTSQCVVTATGLSSACAGCYGAVTACMIDNCLNVCINRNSPLCLSCQDRYCTSAFNTCTGLSK
jgi:hypothetical protein